MSTTLPWQGLSERGASGNCSWKMHSGFSKLMDRKKFSPALKEITNLLKLFSPQKGSLGPTSPKSRKNMESFTHSACTIQCESFRARFCSARRSHEPHNGKKRSDLPGWV